MNKKYNIQNINFKISYNLYDFYSLFTNSISSFFHNIILYRKDLILNGNIISNWVVYKTFHQKKILKARISSDIDLKEIHIEMIPHLFDDPADAEYILIGIAFLEIALRYDYIPIHASAIVYQGEVILIAGPSGTGKSTFARMFCGEYQDAYIINDDKPLLSFNDDQWFVHGTPFSGSHHIHRNESKPLKAIVFMKQSDKTCLNDLSSKEKINHLFKNMYRPSDPHILKEMTQRIERLIHDIPMVELEATHDINPIHLIKNIFYEGKS
jgi:hypothetical protein